jgi:hypothetical protein
MFTAIKSSLRAVVGAEETQETTEKKDNEIRKEPVVFVQNPYKKETILEFDDVNRGKETVLNLESNLLVQDDIVVETSPPVAIDAQNRILVPENPPVVDEQDEPPVKKTLDTTNNNQTFEEQFLLNAFDEEAKALKVTATNDKVLLPDNLLVQEEATKALLWKAVNPANPDEGDLHMASSDHGIIHLDRRMLNGDDSESSDAGTALASPPRTQKRTSAGKRFNEGDTKWLDNLVQLVENDKGKKSQQVAPNKKPSVSTILMILCLVVMEYFLVTRLWMSEAPTGKSKPAFQVASPSGPTQKEMPTVGPVVSDTVPVVPVETKEATKKGKPAVMASSSQAGNSDTIPVEAIVETKVGSPVQPTKKNKEAVTSRVNTSEVLASESVPVEEPKPKQVPKMVTALGDILTNALLVNRGYGH